MGRRERIEDVRNGEKSEGSLKREEGRKQVSLLEIGMIPCSLPSAAVLLKGDHFQC